jgi:signal transduction histidine kinase
LEEHNKLEEDEVLLDIERIHSSARYLLVIINDILDLSKIEAGKTELMLANFSLTDLLMDIKSMVQPMIDKNANHFILDHDNNLYNVLWDELKVRQIIINLISNSAKFTKNGKIILEVKNYIEKNEKYILMKVVDTGIGMSSGEIENIFSPFIQTKSSSFVDQKGTGLGLSITKKYCEMMNGTVSCESVLDKGTTFTIKIPIIIDRRKPIKARRKNEQ